MNLALILSKIGLPSNLAQDVIFLLVIIFASFIFGMFIGRFKLISILINIYVSLAILAAVPKVYLSDYTYRLGFFFILVIILTLVNKRLFEICISGAGSNFLWRIFAMSFLEVMLLVSTVLFIMPKKIALDYVSSTAYPYLASPNAHFIWMIIPLAFIFIIHKRLNR